MTATTGFALGLAACGAVGGNRLALPDTTADTSSGSVVATTAPSAGQIDPLPKPRPEPKPRPHPVGPPAAVLPAQPPGKRIQRPGQPGPSGPPGIITAVGTWHPLFEAGDCQTLLTSVAQLGPAAAQEPGGPPYVSLYKGIAEGCLGLNNAAQTDLEQAVPVGLGPYEASRDITCNSQLLLAYGFGIYLKRDYSPVCPSPTSTTQETTSTTTEQPTSTTG